MYETSETEVWSRYEQAKARRQSWEQLWRECYHYTLPHRTGALDSTTAAGRAYAERLFDGTGSDAVEQLAASLLAELTPPWSGWFGFAPGADVEAVARGEVAEVLDNVAARVQGHFDRSNFAVEAHQAFLDLVTVGTATLVFEEAALGAPSAFRFSVVPAAEMFVEEVQNGSVGSFFRRRRFSRRHLLARFPQANLHDAICNEQEGDPDRRYTVVEAVLPCRQGHDYLALLDGTSLGRSVPILLADGHFDQSPFITFRWLKGAGEIYGRSPVMSALPDIKTANKVVELILKNASIAVTGIWQADDDGVLNPANIRLLPGTIIPKAVGSAGLTPLQAPGRFDVSQLVLDDLRGRIRHTLLVDRLGPVRGARMTATEVLERSNEMTRLLGAVYGRMQSELLMPLLTRALGILQRRGEIPALALDGRLVELQAKSPLAQLQARQGVQNAMLWLETASSLGDEAMRTVDVAATIRWIGHKLGVPGELVRDAEPLEVALQNLAANGTERGDNND